MKKIVLAVLIWAFHVGMSLADFKALSMSTWDRGLNPGAGLAWYNDTDDSCMAGYFQFHAGEITDWLFVDFGATVPFEDVGRTRPHFSMVAIRNPLSFGPFVMVGPYRAWGIQLGLTF